MTRPIVYIVHHVDTEGPLCEPFQEVFNRLENTFGIKLNLPATKASLNQLQKGLVKGIEPNMLKEIQKIVDPHLISFKESWYEVDEMLSRMLTKEYRGKFKDSFGGHWIYNWHIIDHVGFETNERRRDIGYLNIFNHYEQILKETGSVKDEVNWHFHPVSFFYEAHIPATSYENSYPLLHQIISRRLIEKNWFPKINRAGFHTIRPDSNMFMEQWIPFDASNQSLDHESETNQKDAMNGRFGDWRGAPSDWKIYHPDFYDWRKEGGMNRYISRVLNLKTRFRNINKEEIEKAFLKAEKENVNVYLGITNHDFREMTEEIEPFYLALKEVSSKFKKVDFKFSGSLEAFRSVIGYSENDILAEKIDLKGVMKDNVLKISIENGTPFGPQPYLAIKTKTGQYFHDNMDFGIFKKEYFYAFDRFSIEFDKVSNVCIACNDKFGNTDIFRMDIDKDGRIIQKKISS